MHVSMFVYYAYVCVCVCVCVSMCMIYSVCMCMIVCVCVYDIVQCMYTCIIYVHIICTHIYWKTTYNILHVRMHMWYYSSYSFIETIDLCEISFKSNLFHYTSRTIPHT